MTRPKRAILIAILFVSVVLRAGVALYLGDVVDAPPLLTDQRSYHALGERLVAGYGFSFDRNWYPFTTANEPTAHWSFLYSLFVAAVYAVAGPHPLAVRLVQAILGGILLPWLVYRLARRALPAAGERVALLSAAIAAIYLYFVLYAATLMTETFFICAVLWSLERALALDERLRAAGGPFPAGLAASLGVALGLATLLRQSILPWAALLLAFLLWRAWQARRLRPAAASAALAAAVIALFVAPFTLRNALVYGQFLLLNSNAGYAMYSAQHPLHGTSFQEFAAAPLPPGLWGRPEPELDRELMRLGVQFVLDDPGRYLLLSLSRVRAYFEFWPTPDTTLLHNAGRTGSFGLFLPFMLYGLFLSARRRAPGSGLSIVYLFVAFYSVLHVFTWAMVRYRLPVDAVLVVFAAVGLADLYTRGAALATHAHWTAASGEQGAEGALRSLFLALGRLRNPGAGN